MSKVQLEFTFPPRKRLELLTVDEIYEMADQELLGALSEDKRIERKPAGFHGTPLGEYLSMWANTSPDGGILAMGMNDDGSFQGCSVLSSKQLNRLEDPGDLCPDAGFITKRVPIRLLDGREDYVVLIRVFYRKGRVVRTANGEAFIRRADRKRKLRSEEERELAIDKGEVDFEQESCGLRFPDDFDQDAIDGFCRSVRDILELITDASDIDILCTRHLGIFNNGDFIPNFACALLFAKEPDRVIHGCKIRFLRFDGDEEGTGERFNVVKDIWIDGLTIPKLIEQAEKVLESQIRTFSALGRDGRFYTKPEYPKPAWYEAIVNACVHRSYGNGLKNMVTFVKMFDSRLEIESPGPFMPFVTPENIFGTSNPRNPKLMHAMYFMRFVKMAAEGTRRIRDTMKELNLPAPEFSQKEINFSRVRVTLRNNIHHRREWVDTDAFAVIGTVLAATLDENEKRIVNFVAENKKINVSQTVRLTNVSWKTAKRMLDRLVERRILEHAHRSDVERDPEATIVCVGAIHSHIESLRMFLTSRCERAQCSGALFSCGWRPLNLEL